MDANDAGAMERTILVVDDEAEVRRLISHILKRSFSSWKLAEATDLPEAKDLLIAVRPRLLIADLHMPGGNGLELCRLVQEHPWLYKTRALVITGYASPRVREKAFRDGSCEFLSKPFSPSELAGSVGRLVS